MSKTKSINLSFVGYYIQQEVVPKSAGIYLVYIGTYNKDTDRVTLRNLIYIGEAENVNERLNKPHEKQKDWEKYLSEGEILIFSVAEITSPDRERAECALIFHHKPDENDECKDSFPYPETIVESSGACMHISSSIAVKTYIKSDVK